MKTNDRVHSLRMGSHFSPMNFDPWKMFLHAGLKGLISLVKILETFVFLQEMDSRYWACTRTKPRVINAPPRSSFIYFPLVRLLENFSATCKGWKCTLRVLALRWSGNSFPPYVFQHKRNCGRIYELDSTPCRFSLPGRM